MAVPAAVPAEVLISLTRASLTFWHRDILNSLVSTCQTIPALIVSSKVHVLEIV